jgi:hypothetical protein
MTGPEGTILSLRKGNLNKVRLGKRQVKLTNKAKKSVSSTKRQGNASLEPSVGGYMLTLEEPRDVLKGNQIEVYRSISLKLKRKGINQL